LGRSPVTPVGASSLSSFPHPEVLGALSSRSAAVGHPSCAEPRRTLLRDVAYRPLLSTRRFLGTYRARDRCSHEGSGPIPPHDAPRVYLEPSIVLGRYARRGRGNPVRGLFFIATPLRPRAGREAPGMGAEEPSFRGCRRRAIGPNGYGTLAHPRLSLSRSDTGTGNAVSFLDEARRKSSCFG